MTVQLTTRNATLADLATLLKDQQAAKLDVVAPAAGIRSEGGNWLVDGTDVDFVDGDDPGLHTTAGRFAPLAVADEHIADKLGIPLPYLRRLRETRTDLYDANVNGWLHGDPVSEFGAARDPRSFLVRTFRGNGQPGIARALLSDRYKVVDNLDLLTAALDGVRQAGVEVNIDGCDLSERRMYVRVVAPEVKALAPALLANYRSPFGGGIERIRDLAEREGMGYGGNDEPVMFAGFQISNSETGGGAFTIAPRLVVQICRNGMTINADALRSVHLGGRLDEGIVRWSADTLERQLGLVTAQARDAVATFLDADYIAAKVDELTAKAGAPVTDAANTVEVVTSRLRISEAHSASVLDHFIHGGQFTAGGIAQAVSSVAQTISDADVAAEFEALAVRALDVAAELVAV